MTNNCDLSTSKFLLTSEYSDIDRYFGFGKPILHYIDFGKQT